MIHSLPRRTNLFFIVVITLLASFFATSLACADAKSQAKAKFKKGIQYFEDKKYPEALKTFEESYRLRQSTNVLFNIGMCQKAMLKYPESMATFKNILAMDPSRVKAAIREGAKAEVEELEKLLGQLSLEGAPLGAEVKVDNKKVGTTPFSEPIYVAAGSHTVTLTKAGYQPLELSFVVNRGEVLPIRAAMKQVQQGQSRIKVDCPVGASVSLNNRPSVPCPFDESVAPGAYQVAVEAPGKKKDTSSITVEPGQTVSISPTLEETSSQGGTSDESSASTSENTSDDASPAVSKGFLIGGIISTVLGMGGLATGVVFTVQYNKHYSDVDDIATKAKQAQNDDNVPLYNYYVQEFNAARDTFENDKLPIDNAGIIAGYVGGGLLTATGVALLVVHSIKKKKALGDAAYVTPLPGGLTVSF